VVSDRYKGSEEVGPDNNQEAGSERLMRLGREMKVERLKKVVTLAKKVGHVFVATADATGLPHVAAAGRIRLTPEEGRIAVEAWFYPGTVANLQLNQNTSVVVWDPNGDNGYQLLGETEKVEDTAIMNGYAPGLEDKPALPQVERRLLIRVDKIIGFKHSPHTDEEE